MRKTHLYLFLSLLLLSLLPATSHLATVSAAPDALLSVVSIIPTIDTWVNTTPGAITPNPNNQTFYVGADEFTYEAFGLLKFDVSTIPVDATITAAELKVWHEAGNSTNGLADSICIHRLTSDWDEFVTAATAPSIDAVCQTAVSVTNVVGTHTWSPVTTMVQAWVTGTHTNFGLAMKQAETKYGYKAFQAEEGTVQPELKITYSLPTQPEPDANVVQTLSVSPTSSKAGEIVTLTGNGYNPGGYAGTIRWDGTDIIGFEIPGGGLFTTSFTIPAGATVGNHTITVCSLSPCATGEFEQIASVNFNVLPTSAQPTSAPYQIYLPLIIGGTGNSNPPTVAPKVKIDIDPTVKPIAESLPGIEDGAAPRPLGAMSDGKGNVATFVQNEIFVQTDDISIVNQIVADYAGDILLEIDPAGAKVDDLAKMYLIQIDPTAGDVSKLAEMLEDLDASGDIESEHSFSSQAAAGLMAIAGQEALNGAVIGVNWVGEPNDPPDSSSEAFSGGSGYNRNAYNWSYMNRGSVQDIGTADAWNVLIYGGKWDNRVKYAILDKGFATNNDFPAVTSNQTIFPWVTPDGERGSSSSPWHGTHVMQTAMAESGNGYGIVGVAHTVAEPINIYTGYDYVTSIASVLLARANGAKVINMSYSAQVPAIVSFTVIPFEHTTRAVRASGTLLFASAGNDYVDVDGEDCVPFFNWPCWEHTWITPCENAGVICVGGIGWNSTIRARSVDGSGRTVGGSNWGSDGTVQIFAPYTVYRGADPDNLGMGSNVGTINGTSFSSPYAGGVAALIWAADPSLSAGQVWNIMRDTAHTSPDSSVPRYVNAYAAIRQAVGQSASAEIINPSNGRTIPKNQTFTMRAELGAVINSDTTFNVTWSSNRDGTLNSSPWNAPAGYTGTENSFTASSLSDGTHTITLRMTGGGITKVDTVQITILNTRPTANIIFPAANAEFCVGELVNLSGSSFDPNQLSGIPGSGYSWQSSRDGGLGTGNPRGITSLSIGNHTMTLTVTDDGGLSQTATTNLAVLPASDPDCINHKPTAVITSPANGSSFDADTFIDGSWVKQVTLFGQIGDTEDAIADLTVQWIDSVDGALGSGSVNTTTGVVSMTHNFTAAGCGTNHTITLRVTDSGGKMSDIIPYGITISLLC